MPTVTGCHLVGSVPLADTHTVFKTCSEAMPGRLKRIPDGETGPRRQFVCFQAPLFPPLIRAELDPMVPLPPKSKVFTPEEFSTGISLLEQSAKKMKTGYDNAALESYKVFCQLKKDGTIPHDIKFQVSITTLGNVVGSFVSSAFRPKAEKFYEDALFQAIHNIQNEIPHSELAIQLDMGVDMLYWVGEWDEPWWSDRSYLVGYISRMANQVHADVDLGFHFCYGDMAHRHVVEPVSLQGVADFAANIFKECQRPANFIHCPVPLSALDKLDAYFEPFRALVPRLQQDKTEVYLGVVHAHNLDATRKMIRAAGKVVPEFGVATECGWGRTPEGDLGSIMEISTIVSNPQSPATPDCDDRS